MDAILNALISIATWAVVIVAICKAWGAPTKHKASCYDPDNDERESKWLALGGKQRHRQEVELGEPLRCWVCHKMAPGVDLDGVQLPARCRCIKHLKRFKPAPAAFSENENGKGYIQSFVRDGTIHPLTDAERERFQRRKKYHERENQRSH